MKDFSGWLWFIGIVLIILAGIQIIRHYMIWQMNQKNVDNNNGHKDWR